MIPPVFIGWGASSWHQMKVRPCDRRARCEGGQRLVGKARASVRFVSAAGRQPAPVRGRGKTTVGLAVVPRAPQGQTYMTGGRTENREATEPPGLGTREGLIHNARGTRKGVTVRFHVDGVFAPQKVLPHTTPLALVQLLVSKRLSRSPYISTTTLHSASESARASEARGRGVTTSSCGQTRRTR